MSSLTGDRTCEHLWSWRYDDGEFAPFTQDHRSTIAELLEEIERQWIDDSASNWIEFDQERIATILGPTDIRLEKIAIMGIDPQRMTV